MGKLLVDAEEGSLLVVRHVGQGDAEAFRALRGLVGEFVACGAAYIDGNPRLQAQMEAQREPLMRRESSPSQTRPSPPSRPFPTGWERPSSYTTQPALFFSNRHMRSLPKAVARLLTAMYSGNRMLCQSAPHELVIRLAYYLRLTTYYLLLTTYYLPLTTYYLLLTTYYLLLTLLNSSYLLLTTYYRYGMGSQSGRTRRSRRRTAPRGEGQRARLAAQMPAMASLTASSHASLTCVEEGP